MTTIDVSKTLVSLLLTGLSVGLVPSCNATTSSPENSETHFLSLCGGRCSAGLTCICGVCTNMCEETSSCTALESNAVCVPGCSEGKSAAGMCDVLCSIDADCTGVATNLRCSAGRCRQEPNERRTDSPGTGSDAGEGSGNEQIGGMGSGGSDAGSEPANGAGNNMAGGGENLGGASGAASTGNAGGALDGSTQDGGALDGSTQDGGTSSGVQPRVLVGDKSAGTIVVYDKAGRPLRDLKTELDLGSGYDDINIVVEGRMYGWKQGATPRSSTQQPVGALPTLGEPLEASCLVTFGHPMTSGPARVRLATVRGERTAELDVSGPSDGVAVSPRRQFLYASAENTSSVSGKDASVVRISDGQVIWKEINISGPAFARDDSHFTTTRGNAEIQLADLTTGATSTLPIPALVGKYGSSRYLLAEGTSPWGAALKTYEWVTNGQALFYLGWNGTISPFDENFPEYGDETVVGSQDLGRRILWVRRENGYGSVDPSLLGYFEFDTTTLTTKKLDAQLNPRCLSEPTRTYYELNQSTLMRCTCPSAACEAIANPPALDRPWDRSVTTAPGGRVVAVVPYWAMNASPSTDPDVLLYDRTGQLLTQIPGGSPEFDATGSLVLLQRPNEVLIIDLDPVRVTTIHANGFAAIVYE